MPGVILLEPFSASTRIGRIPGRLSWDGDDPRAPGGYLSPLPGCPSDSPGYPSSPPGFPSRPKGYHCWSPGSPSSSGGSPSSAPGSPFLLAGDGSATARDRCGGSEYPAGWGYGAAESAGDKRRRPTMRLASSRYETLLALFNRAPSVQSLSAGCGDCPFRSSQDILKLGAMTRGFLRTGHFLS